MVKRLAIKTAEIAAASLMIALFFNAIELATLIGYSRRERNRAA